MVGNDTVIATAGRNPVGPHITKQATGQDQGNKETSEPQ